jgi:hypothetical protein
VVVGDANNGHGDEVLENFLFDQLGMFVTVADDTDDPASFFRSFDLIVIAPSADPAALARKYESSRLPVVVMNAGVFAALGMTGSSPDAFGTALGTDIFVTPEGAKHPIGQFFPDLPGVLPVASEPIPLNFGVPAAGATVVATLVDNPERATIFFYEAGATMSTQEAPGRRVGFWYQNTDDDITAPGEQLIENTIIWAANLPLR